jgi:hypothetical protein
MMIKIQCVAVVGVTVHLPGHLLPARRGGRRSNDSAERAARWNEKISTSGRDDELLVCLDLGLGQSGAEQSATPGAVVQRLNVRLSALPSLADNGWSEITFVPAAQWHL